MLNKTLFLEIDKPNYVPIYTVQYDYNSRFYEITILNNSQPLDLTGIRVIVAGKKPDGKEVFNSCKVLDAKKGLIQLELTEQMNAVNGASEYALELFSADGMLSSQPFKLIVTRSTISKSVESSKELGALKDALNEVQDIDNRFAQTNAQLSQKMDIGGEILVSQINKNKGKFDQTYMTDEFLQQIAGNAQINSTPALRSITRPKLAVGSVGVNEVDFIKTSKNLFNFNTITKGYYINSSGDLIEDANDFISDFIEVEPSTLYSYDYFTFISYYDENKNFIKRISKTQTSHSTPANCAYIRVSATGINDMSDRQVVKGNILPDFEYWHEPYFKDEMIFKNECIKKEFLSIRSVEPKHTTFIASSSNLIDHNRISKNSFINANTGVIEFDENYLISDFVDVVPNEEYISNGLVACAFYDKDKKFLRKTYTLNGVAFTTPSNAYFLRMNSNVKSGWQLNKGSILLDYEPYKLTLDGVELKKDYIDDLFKTTDRIIFDIPINGVFNSDTNSIDLSNSRDITSKEVYALYDELQATHQSYITKTNLGDDLWGNEISVYSFKPLRPSSNKNTKLPKVFINCGIHGYEHVSALTMYLVMKDICEKWKSNDLLEALRYNVEFLIIPVSNPSGWNDYTRKNRNGVDINRNFPNGWSLQDSSSNTYGGPSPLSELESQYIHSFLQENKDIDIVIDFHNFSGSLENFKYMWVTGTTQYLQHIAQCYISRMTRKWQREYDWISQQDNEVSIGYTDGGGYIGSLEDQGIYNGCKFSYTYELCSKWHIKEGAKQFDEIYKKTCVEAIVNFILINLRQLEFEYKM